MCSINAQRCAIVLLGNLLAVIRGHSLEFNSSCHNEAVPTRRRRKTYVCINHSMYMIWYMPILSIIYITIIL